MFVFPTKAGALSNRYNNILHTFSLGSQVLSPLICTILCTEGGLLNYCILRS